MDSQITERPHEHYSERPNGSLRQSVKNSCSKVEQCIQKSPQSSMLISLGAGLGVGILLGAILGGRSRYSSRGWMDRHTAEHLGQRMMNQLGSLLPDAVSERLSR